jgi:aryl-alcohol dehydrogenase-like predicted oxidoreductase
LRLASEIEMKRIADTDLLVSPLCLGCNVFGWTIDEPQAFAVLDAYASAGGNFLDTADSYTAWVAGNRGGESEESIGRWMEKRGNRERLVIATKVGQAPGLEGLSASTIRRAAEASLRRLRTDRIDLYYAHVDDIHTPLEETLSAFDALVREGKVRYVAASNYSAVRLADALAVSKRDGLARYSAIQPHYNLVHRDEYEGELSELCVSQGVACVPYYGLANGFLTGKYRAGQPSSESPRATLAAAYLDETGIRLLTVLDAVATVHETTIAAVALAWLAMQPTVVAPIASARTPGQLAELLQMASCELSDGELRVLRDAATWS